jgi:hypothetical protein
MPQGARSLIFFRQQGKGLNPWLVFIRAICFIVSPLHRIAPSRFARASGVVAATA